MTRDEAAERLRDDEYELGYVRPAYEDYCFANVSPTAADLLGVDAGRTLPADAVAGLEDVSNVLTVLIDGVRYDRWLETDAPLFARAREHGTTVPLTSVYPSETAAVMTTYNTGRQPVEHGLLGWEQYFPPLDEVGLALKGTSLDGRSLQPAVDGGFESFEGGTIHRRLADAGLGAAVVNPESTLSHPFSAERYDGASTHPYDSPGEGAVEARAALESGDSSLVSFYYHHVDSVSHTWGTGTPHYGATLHGLSASIERAFRGLDQSVAEETAVLFTADHGHLDTTPGGIDLRDRPEVIEQFRRGPDGEPLGPTGGGRNVHLHLREGSVETVRELLSGLDALQFTREEAIEADLFGDREPSDRFLASCGDLVLVPRETSVWDDPIKFEHVGQHGGLHPDEMLVPFTAVGLADLLEGA